MSTGGQFASIGDVLKGAGVQFALAALNVARASRALDEVRATQGDAITDEAIDARLAAAGALEERARELRSLLEDMLGSDPA